MKEEVTFKTVLAVAVAAAVGAFVIMSLIAYA